MKNWHAILIAGAMIAAAISFRTFETENAFAAMGRDTAQCFLDYMDYAHTQYAGQTLFNICQQHDF